MSFSLNALLLITYEFKLNTPAASSYRDEYADRCTSADSVLSLAEILLEATRKFIICYAMGEVLIVMLFDERAPLLVHLLNAFMNLPILVVIPGVLKPHAPVAEVARNAEDRVLVIEIRRKELSVGLHELWGELSDHKRH